MTLRSRVVIRTQEFIRKSKRKSKLIKTVQNKVLNTFEVEEEDKKRVTNNKTADIITTNGSKSESDNLGELKNLDIFTNASNDKFDHLKSPTPSQNSIKNYTTKTYVLSKQNLDYLAKNLEIKPSTLWNNIFDITKSSCNAMSLTPTSSKSSKINTQESHKTNKTVSPFSDNLNNTPNSIRKLSTNSFSHNDDIINADTSRKFFTEVSNGHGNESLEKLENLLENDIEKLRSTEQSEINEIEESVISVNVDKTKYTKSLAADDKSTLTERSISFESEEDHTSAIQENITNDSPIHTLTQQNINEKILKSPELTFGSDPSLTQLPTKVSQFVESVDNNSVQQFKSPEKTITSAVNNKHNSPQLTFTFEIKEASESDILNRLRGIFDSKSDYSQAVHRSPDLFSDDQLSLE